MELTNDSTNELSNELPDELNPEYLLKRAYKIIEKYPGEEMLIVHDNKINKLSLYPIIKKLMINRDKYICCHPLVIFSYIAINTDPLIENSEIFKISINKYQDLNINSNGINIKVKTFDTINDIMFNNINITRYPQLRRLLFQYYRLIGKHFDNKSLYNKLIDLNVDNKNYNYYDADEQVLLFDYKGTYLELLPIELKNIIIEHVDDFDYITTDDLKYTDPFINLIEKITDNVLKDNDKSILDIMNDIEITNELNEAKNFVSGNNSDWDLLKYITTDLGLGTIFGVVGKKS